MNIAMLGSGFIGRFYADSLQGYRNKDKVVTVYSRKEESAKKFAKDYEVAFATTSMEAAINRPEVEVVCIALPNNLHEEAVMLCCKHKKAGDHHQAAWAEMVLKRNVCSKQWRKPESSVDISKTFVIRRSF